MLVEAKLQLVDPTETVPLLAPSLISDAGVAPKHIIRVDGPLDLMEPFVVAAPEVVLPVGHGRVGLQ